MTGGGKAFWSSTSEVQVDRSRPRLLLISYHFPPGHGTGGARWEKFAPALVRAGWGLDVITLDPSCVSDPDWDRVGNLPAHVRLFGARQPRVWTERLESGLGAVYSVLKPLFRPRTSDESSKRDRASVESTDLPGLEAISVDELPPVWSSPRALLRAFWSWSRYERERAWVREAVARALEVLNPEVHRVIATTAPPHLTHSAGRLLVEESGIPLVLDFRDAWKVTEVLPEHVASPLWLRWAETEESACMAASSLVVANTDPLRRQLVDEYPEAENRIMTVLNGWAGPVGSEAAAPERFIIAYAGAFYLNRNPRVLMRGVASFVRGRDLRPDDATLEFMGNMHDFGPGLRAMASEEGLEDHLRLHPESPREEAHRFLSRASVLVSLPQSQTLAIPSKIFDYMSCNAWIVAQTREGSATDRLLRGTGAEVVPPDDPGGLAHILERKYRKYLCSGRPSPLAKTCPELSAETQAARLIEALDRFRTRKIERTSSRVGS